jgi:hypothetical protein
MSSTFLASLVSVEHRFNISDRESHSKNAAVSAISSRSVLVAYSLTVHIVRLPVIVAEVTVPV